MVALSDGAFSQMDARGEEIPVKCHLSWVGADLASWGNGITLEAGGFPSSSREGSIRSMVAEDGWLLLGGCINGNMVRLAEEGISPHVVIQEPKRRKGPQTWLLEEHVAVNTR